MWQENGKMSATPFRVVNVVIVWLLLQYILLNQNVRDVGFLSPFVASQINKHFDVILLFFFFCWIVPTRKYKQQTNDRNNEIQMMNANFQKRN